MHVTDERTNHSTRTFQRTPDKKNYYNSIVGKRWKMRRCIVFSRKRLKKIWWKTQWETWMLHSTSTHLPITFWDFTRHSSDSKQHKGKKVVGEGASKFSVVSATFICLLNHTIPIELGAAALLEIVETMMNFRILLPIVLRMRMRLERYIVIECCIKFDLSRISFPTCRLCKTETLPSL